MQNNQLTARPRTKFATAGLFRKFGPLQQCSVKYVRQFAGRFLQFLPVRRIIMIAIMLATGDTDRGLNPENFVLTYFIGGRFINDLVRN